MDGIVASNLSSTSPTLTGPELFSPGYVIGLITVNIIFAAVGTFGNVLVLIVILKNQCLQTIPDLFIFSLASADLTVTALRQPMLAYEANNHFELHTYTIGFEAVKNVVNVGTYATIVCLFAVTIDRFLAIQHPFKYQLYCTKKRAIIAIVVCWITAGLIKVVVAIYPRKGEYFVWAFTFISLIATIAIYLHLFCVANKQQNRIVAVQPLEQIAGGQQPGRQTRERKAAKTIALVVGVYILFYVPFLVYTISQNRKPDFRLGIYCFFSFRLCNSAVNPYIYCMRNTRYRLAFASILRLKRNAQLNTSGSVNHA